jgi:ABC-type branched-subunit amino acid transport system ATPase component
LVFVAKKTRDLARAGLGWVAQEREIFPSLSVEENVTVAARPGRWDLAALVLSRNEHTALLPRSGSDAGDGDLWT